MKNTMEPYERLLFIVEALGMTNKAFAASVTGLNPAAFSNMKTKRTKPSFNILSGIHDRYPLISFGWLLTGRGNPFPAVYPWLNPDFNPWYSDQLQLFKRHFHFINDTLKDAPQDYVTHNGNPIKRDCFDTVDQWSMAVHDAAKVLHTDLALSQEISSTAVELGRMKLREQLKGKDISGMDLSKYGL